MITNVIYVNLLKIYTCTLVEEHDLNYICNSWNFASKRLSRCLATRRSRMSRKLLSVDFPLFSFPSKKFILLLFVRILFRHAIPKPYIPLPYPMQPEKPWSRKQSYRRHLRNHSLVGNRKNTIKINLINLKLLTPIIVLSLPYQHLLW